MAQPADPPSVPARFCAIHAITGPRLNLLRIAAAGRDFMFGWSNGLREMMVTSSSTWFICVFIFTSSSTWFICVFIFCDNSLCFVVRQC
jgi:hypothetical protein